MATEKITLPIGSNKALIFEADTGDKDSMAFANQCKEVAATQPQTIQEFFMRLSDLQQKQPPPVVRKKQGRKI